MSHAKVDARLGGELDNLGLVQLRKRRVDTQVRPALDAGLGREVRHVFGTECGDELGAAIRITRVINRIHADENIGALEHFRPSHRVSQKNRIARGDICDRDAFGQAVLGNLDVSGKRAAAESPQVNADHAMLTNAEMPGDARRGFELDTMALSVVE